jgi:pimeloyl-ACP methyl ester carboxylesterase
MMRLPQPRPTRSDLKSFSALQAWWTRADYEGIRVPILAIYAVFRSARDLAPWLRTDDELKLRAIAEAYSYGTAARERAFNAFGRAAHSQIVKLHGADHYVFLSHADALVSELQTFVSSVR